jgi:hypothetical protein
MGTTTRKGSTGIALTEAADTDEDMWKCTVCEKIFSSDKDEVMECEYCEKHTCRKCLGISQNEYKVLTKRSDAHWFCPICEKKAVSNIRCEKLIEDRCNAYLEKVEARIKRLEDEIKEKPSEARVLNLIDMKLEDKGYASAAEVQNVVETRIGSQSVNNAREIQLEEKIQELQERESRKNNIVIYNSDEPEAEDSEDRKDEDRQFTNDLCLLLESDSNDIVSTIRLGIKRTKDNGEAINRPLKVIFRCEKTKTDILRNAKKLQYANEKFKKISISQDMTRKEREKQAQLFQEAKRLNEENSSGDFKFIVKGPVWDRKVVKIKLKQ